jgi:hypothetical protein
MLAVFGMLRRVAHRQVILIPALVMPVALAGSVILGLLLGLGTLQAGSAPFAGTTALKAAAAGGRGMLPGGGSALPVSTVTWQPTAYAGTSDGNLAPAMHPTDPMRALLGGPLPLLYTTDSGASWHSAIGLSGLGQGVPVWLPGGGNGQSALQVSLSQGAPQESLTPGPTGSALNISRSTDSGVHWAAPITLTLPGLSENLPHLWADANPSSPHYGRIYLTLTMLDAARTGSFDTVGVLFSTDQGATWSTPVGLVDPTEFAQGMNYNAFASAAIQPDGAVVVAWHRGTCCRTITNVPNKVMWSRSTDGGITFPVSGTIATVPVSQSLEYNSMSPGGYFRWTPAPNIAADPVDGTLYSVWLAYRQPNTPTSAAIYLSRSTDNGASWSAPVVVDNNGPYIFQFVPWVQVSPDHAVHVTYQAATSVVDVIGHFYIQSTDRGATWSTPFALSLQGHINGAVQGDFQATSLGGYNGSQGTILTSWEDELGTGVRSGTFPLGGGTPSPTSTPTHAPTNTSTRTATPALPTFTSTIAPPSSTPVPPSPTPRPPTSTVGASPTTCAISFSDVPSGSTFYPYVRCLACRGIVAGYPDGTFRPNNNVTRGQISKMVSNAAGFVDSIPSDRQTYQDVPHSNLFWVWIERLTQHSVMSGYGCGGAGEPCVPPHNRPYFRWAANATRAQLSKIDSNAAGYGENHTEQTFEDVPPSHPFYIWVQRMASRGIVGGYQCGSPGEPCIPPQDRPYFRPYNSVTRGQAAKIVSNTFYPECRTPGSR